MGAVIAVETVHSEHERWKRVPTGLNDSLDTHEHGNFGLGHGGQHRREWCGSNLDMEKRMHGRAVPILRHCPAYSAEVFSIIS